MMRVVGLVSPVVPHLGLIRGGFPRKGNRLLERAPDRTRDVRHQQGVAGELRYRGASDSPICGRRMASAQTTARPSVQAIVASRWAFVLRDSGRVITTISIEILGFRLD